MSFREDVRWNWVAAEEAISKLYYVANELTNLSRTRNEKATLVHEEAAGHYRDKFDTDFDCKLGANTRHANDCRRLARRIRELSEQADEEQTRRERAREQRKKKEREHNLSEF